MELYIGHSYNFRLKDGDGGGDGDGSACRIGSNKCILKSRDYMEEKRVIFRQPVHSQGSLLVTIL